MIHIVFKIKACKFQFLYGGHMDIRIEPIYLPCLFQSIDCIVCFRLRFIPTAHIIPNLSYADVRGSGIRPLQKHPGINRPFVIVFVLTVQIVQDNIPSVNNGNC